MTPGPEASSVTDAVVLAGGLGTRLRPVVDDVPKPLAPVAGRPFLAWLLDALAAGGLRRVVLATGYRGEMIEAAIGSRHAGMAVAYSREAEPQGTGGALRDALGQAHGRRVLVLNGDTYTRIDYAAMDHATPGAPVAMAVHRVEDRSRYGSVIVQAGQVRGFAEKAEGGGPGWINTGTYLVDPGLPALRRDGAFSFERDALQAGLAELAMAAHEVAGPFIDIGTPEDYARAQSLLPAWHEADRRPVPG